MSRKTGWSSGVVSPQCGNCSHTHAILPIMLGDARLAQRMAADLLEEGIYVVGFASSVVPRGLARIRVQISGAHEPAHLKQAVAALVKVGRALGVI